MKSIHLSKIPALLLFILTACEGGTTFTKTISNESTDTLYVKVYTYQTQQETVSIPPNQPGLIFWDDKMGRFTEESYSCTSEMDSVRVTTSGNKTLKKDLMNSGNWSRQSKDGRNSREDCTITITDQDLQ